MSVEIREPKSLGAVVEDARGTLWVRIGGEAEAFSADAWWRRAGGGAPYNERRHFENIDVARVLSKGIPS